MTASGSQRRIAGRYTLLRSLGRGGMGTVWAAHDELLRRDVAVKEVVPPAGLTDEQDAELRERTLREARAAARISSPAAVTVYDVVEEGGRPWIVMQQLHARTLADIVRTDGPLPADEAARIGLALLDALEAAHAAGVLHRDVKPANVMVTADGAVVLTDFGIASLEGDPALTTTGIIVGSPAYVAPERARGGRPSSASDLWSLGATLYTAVEGRSPFDRGGQVPTLLAVVSEDLDPPLHAGPLRPALEGLLAKDPERRLDIPAARALLRTAAERPAPASAPAAPAPAPVEVADRTQVMHALAVPGVAAAGVAAGGAAGAAAAGAAGMPSSVAAAPASAATAAPAAAPAVDAPEPAVDAAPAVDAPEQAAQPVAHRADRPGDALAPEPDGPEPVPEPDSEPTEPRPRRRVRWLAPALLAALALGLVVGFLALGSNDPPAGREAAPDPEVSAPAAGAPAGDSATGEDAGATDEATEDSDGTGSDADADDTADTGDTGDDGGDDGGDAEGAAEGAEDTDGGQEGTEGGSGEGAAAVAPEGFQVHEDPTGFAVAVPQGWEVSRDGTRTYLRDPERSRLLLVDQTRDPKPDPVADWEAQEATVSQRLPGYERVGIEAVDYRGWNAADWEFTWDGDNGRVHVRNRGVVTGPDRAYALYWSVPDSQWEDNEEVFDAIAASFRPAS